MATPRVAKAVKAEIPCEDDLVGKLEDIGDQTRRKLSDLHAAVDTCGALGLVLPFSSVTTGWSLASHRLTLHKSDMFMLRWNLASL